MGEILTNKAGLPLPLYNAIKNDTYERRGDISVTTLINHPYRRMLMKYTDYEVDASEKIWSLLGQSVHAMIERASGKHGKTEFVSEEKMEMNVNGKILTGTTDLREVLLEREMDTVVTGNAGNVLHDWKVTSVFNAMKSMKEGNKKWVQQLNTYAAILRSTLGIEVTNLYIHAILRDWQKSKSKYNTEYPPNAIVTINIPVYKQESVMKFINQKMQLHFDMEQKYLNGEEIEHCDADDRWARPEVWAMMKPGRKSSLKNFEIKSPEDEHAAKLWYANKLAEVSGLEIEKRPGEDIMCVDYCPVNESCRYYKSRYGAGEQRKERIGIDTGRNSGSESKPKLPEFKF